MKYNKMCAWPSLWPGAAWGGGLSANRSLLLHRIGLSHHAEKMHAAEDVCTDTMHTLMSYIILLYHIVH